MLGFEHFKFMNWYLEYQTVLLLKNLFLSLFKSLHRFTRHANSSAENANAM